MKSQVMTWLRKQMIALYSNGAKILAYGIGTASSIVPVWPE